MGQRRDLVRLLQRTMGWTIRDVRVRELESPLTVVAAPGVEGRGMVRESERVSFKKTVEATPCRVELRLGLFKPRLRGQGVGEAPMDLRIRT